MARCSLLRCRPRCATWRAGGHDCCGVDLPGKIAMIPRRAIRNNLNTTPYSNVPRDRSILCTTRLGAVSSIKNGKICSLKYSAFKAKWWPYWWKTNWQHPTVVQCLPEYSNSSGLDIAATRGHMSNIPQYKKISLNLLELSR